MKINKGKVLFIICFGLLVVVSIWFAVYRHNVKESSSAFLINPNTYQTTINIFDQSWKSFPINVDEFNSIQRYCNGKIFFMTEESGIFEYKDGMFSRVFVKGLQKYTENVPFVFFSGSIVKKRYIPVHVSKKENPRPGDLQFRGFVFYNTIPNEWCFTPYEGPDMGMISGYPLSEPDDTAIMLFYKGQEKYGEIGFDVKKHEFKAILSTTAPGVFQGLGGAPQ